MTMSQIPHENELLALLDEIRKLERDFKLRRRFNIFEALNISKQEIRHSRFLAYLLDPHAAHGLGDRFLRGLLLAAADGHPQLPVTRLELSIKDLSDASVQCERDHFDITVQVPSIGLLFVIENKVDAAESDSQLRNYRESAKAKYPEYTFMGSFLTPDGYEGGDAHWGTMSYATVANEIRSILTETTLPPDVLLALNHYVDLIESKIMTSQALIDACREIYRTHKSAFDLVIEHGQESLLGMAFDQFLSKEPSLEAVARRTATVYFLAKDWKLLGRANKADKKRWPHELPVLFWFELKESKLLLRLEVGPIDSDNDGERKRLVDLFKTKFNTSRASSSSTYTRVLMMQQKLKEDPVVDDVLAAMNSLWKKWRNDYDGQDPVKDLLSRWVEESS